MRAGLLAKKHLIDVLDPTGLSPEKLAHRLVEDLERDDYPVQNGALPMDGIKHAAIASRACAVGAYAPSA